MVFKMFYCGGENMMVEFTDLAYRDFYKAFPFNEGLNCWDLIDRITHFSDPIAWWIPLPTA